MSEFDDLYCPFEAEVVAAVPMRLLVLIHAVGLLALLIHLP